MIITCPIHGNFLQSPQDHLNGNGCQKCKSEVYKKKGGFNNDMFFVNNSEAYKKWQQMIKRCGNPKYPAYLNCTICKEWHTFSNYESWHNEHYIEGFALDKDILIKGNKEYSPTACCFVPQCINSLFIKCKSTRGEYPIGVKKNIRGCFSAQINMNKKVYLGTYRTTEEAFQAYKVAKEAWIKEVANKWKDQLEPKVYDALINYKVEITD